MKPSRTYGLTNRLCRVETLQTFLPCREESTHDLLLEYLLGLPAAGDGVQVRAGADRSARSGDRPPQRISERPLAQVRRPRPPWRHGAQYADILLYL